MQLQGQFSTFRSVDKQFIGHTDKGQAPGDIQTITTTLDIIEIYQLD